MPINLVFQGGGVRGIAYAGVLDKIPQGLSIKGTGGTSAGSIVAALLGISKTPAQIKDILERKDMHELLHPDDEERLQRILTGINALHPLITQTLASGKLPKFGLFKVRQQVRLLLKELGCVWRERGLHRSDKLGDWLDEILGERTFDDATVEDIQIVAADVSGRKYEIYSKEKYRGKKLAHAVHASCSIPVFFHPFLEGVDVSVDGGILSNYPAFLFAQSKYPTIGFRLKDLAPLAAGAIADTLHYLQAVLETMAEAHDKLRPLPRHIFSYEIFTPPHIRFNNFRLSADEKRELFYAGQQVGERVKWQEHESQERQVAFFDPNADETLEFSVSQARALYDTYAAKQSWLESLHDDVVLTVRIEKDWSATYQRVQAMRTKGPKSLFLRKFRRAGEPHRQGGPVSFMRTPVTLRELIMQESHRDTFLGQIKDGELVDKLCVTYAIETRDVIRIPAYNSDSHKGFIVFFTPPIAEENAERIFLSIHTVEREFVRIPDGETAMVDYGVQRMAKRHTLSLQVQILVDTALQPQPLFAPAADCMRAPRQIGYRYYTQQVWNFDTADVGGETAHSIVLRRGQP